MTYTDDAIWKSLKFLRELHARGGIATMTGNRDHRPLDPLVHAGLVSSCCLNSQTVEYRLEPRGAALLSRIDG